MDILRMGDPTFAVILKYLPKCSCFFGPPEFALA